MYRGIVNIAVGFMLALCARSQVTTDALRMRGFYKTTRERPEHSFWSRDSRPSV